jgi:hypothetical protein
MMIRDMDIAAELMGVRPLQPSSRPLPCRPTSAAWPVRCSCSSISGAAEPEAFSITPVLPDPVHGDPGRAGEPGGCFMGAAFIWILPICEVRSGAARSASMWAPKSVEHITHDRRRIDHLLPDCRAARACPACGRSGNRNSGSGRSPTIGGQPYARHRPEDQARESLSQAMPERHGPARGHVGEEWRHWSRRRIPKVRMGRKK